MLIWKLGSAAKEEENGVEQGSLHWKMRAGRTDWQKGIDLFWNLQDKDTVLFSSG